MAMYENQRAYRFRNALNPKPGASIDLWDQRVAEDIGFIAIPTMGAIIPGWILVVPRRPVMSIAELGKREHAELRTFRHRVVQMVAQAFGAPTVFEHGAGYAGSDMGCGVDHAHLHIVPLEFDLIHSVQKDNSLEIEWNETPNEEEVYRSIRPGDNYMSVISPTGKIIYASGFTPSPQYLRKIIARRVGLDTEWDYRSNPFHSNVAETLARLQEFC